MGETILAEGGTARVSLIERKDTRWVEKELLPKYQGKADFEWLQRREYEILSQLDHPLILQAQTLKKKYSQAGFETTVICMEYVEGWNLASILSFLKGLTNEQRRAWAREYLAQSLTVLHYLREQNVLHGDIAPSNVLVTKDGMIKWIDFATALTPQHQYLPFQIQGREDYQPPEGLQLDGFERELYRFAGLYEEVLGPDLRGSQELRWVESLRLGQMPELNEVWSEAHNLSSLWPLPSHQAQFIAGFREKTSLEKGTLPKNAFLNAASICFLVLGTCLFLSSWAPLGKLSVNTLPHGELTISLGGEVRHYETPVQSLVVPAGRVSLSVSDHGFSKIIELSHGEHFQFFEDLRKLDIVKQ